MKKIVTLILLQSLSLSAFADVCKKKKNKDKSDLCIELADSHRCASCPPPCKENGYQFGFYMNIDLLYWQAKQRGLEYAIKNRSGALNIFDNIIIDPDFDWEVAYRVGLGLNLPHDDWDLEMVYTHFDTRAQSRALAGNVLTLVGGPGLIPTWTHPAAFFSDGLNIRFDEALSTWRFDYNVWNIHLQKEFFVGNALSVRPYWGFKNSYLTQRYNIDYNNGNNGSNAGLPFQVNNANVNVKNITFGLGPMLGFETRWNVSPSWSIFFDGAGSLLATHFDLSNNQRISTTQLITEEDVIRFQDDFWSFKPQAEIRTGINYGWCRSRRNNTVRYIGISLAYEAQVWWQQNQIPRFIDNVSLGKTLNTRRDLFMQGINFDLRADF